MEPLIQFKDFTFKYDAQAEPTLKSLNLPIEKGQKVLIVGPSGSGKSTIGQCLNGIIPNINHGEKSGQCATIQTATLLHTTSRWLTVPYSPSIKIWRSLPSQTIFLTISLIKVRFSSIVSVWKLSLKLDNAVDSIST